VLGERLMTLRVGRITGSVWRADFMRIHPKIADDVLPAQALAALNTAFAQLLGVAVIPRRARGTSGATCSKTEPMARLLRRPKSVILPVMPPASGQQDDAAAHLAAIVESSDDAIVSKTLDGVITSWNRAAERMFGWTSAEAIGRNITLIIPKDRHPEEIEVLARLRRGERVEHFDTVRVRKDGTSIDISLTVSPVLNASGAVVGASKIARDISDRKEIERMRAGIIAREQEARAAAEAANQLKEDFLAVLSHELRTPLSTAMGWVRLIEAGQLGPEEAQKGIGAVRRSLDQQLRLINDLLDLSSMAAGKTQILPQYLDLCELVRLEAEAWRATALAAKIELITFFEGPAPIYGDPERLNQVFSNLMANAIKFTPQGGRVSVSVGMRGADAYIVVTDTGRGIEGNFLPHVFERFRQGETSTTRRVGGVGLGLAIVRSLVELHGGQVRAESDGPGRGACFTITLPLASAARSPRGVE
jgi:PAS domain S-box-containing protein